jgi:isoleucyl-tRNA synthetase
MTNPRDPVGNFRASRSMGTYDPVPAQVELSQLDQEVLTFWRERKVFERSLQRSRTAQSDRRWTLYEGPPTANGLPGVHHVEARVFKDVFARFKTMQGFHVERRAGWDCHGLPVELAAEKDLGFSGRGQIEGYGVAEFNARCRTSVLRHVAAFEEMTQRMGYWVDMANAYQTMDPSYVESVWWALKQIYDTGLLIEESRVTPYCPRCGTGLSDHELAQGYETVTDPSVYVRLPLKSGPYGGSASLLIWTTTPWTLVANTAVAVHPDVPYVVAANRNRQERLVVAQARHREVLGEEWTVERTITGRQMERWAYESPFDLVRFPEAAHHVVLADYVGTDEGTGLVHLAPAFGADDMRVARAYALPVINPVNLDGRFEQSLGLVGGQFFKHADSDLIDDLASRGRLFRHQPYEHSYPHCWRCHTPLLYYSRAGWYIRTTAVKARLLRENKQTTWFPETIKWGRYGDWLRNNVDWALSRDRYWGTPLPLWRCEDAHETWIGSLADLTALTGTNQAGLDPHRPYVDEVTFPCPHQAAGTGSTGCRKAARRVPEVVDAWFDSGSMPFAQWGYPHVDGSAEKVAATYPADFISEAIDQTRGWFYTLMVIGTLLFDRSPYRNALALGHILAADGRKMSKHLGNVVEPIGVMEEHGADAVRWFMAVAGSPWASRRIDHRSIEQGARNVLITYWNIAAFQALYARASHWRPGDQGPDLPDRPVLDRWLRAETVRAVRDVTSALEQFDTQHAGAILTRFIGDVSSWYVRRSRRRFWQGDTAAFATLHHTLHTLTLLLAPLAPFITEQIWQKLVRSVNADAADSVHLAPWPEYGQLPTDEELSTSVALARRLVEQGRAARAKAKVRTRQPLRRALVGSAAWQQLGPELRREVAEELNVETLEPFASSVDTDLMAFTAKPNFRALGRRFAQDTPRVAAAIQAADASRMAHSIRADGRAVVMVDDEVVEVLPSEVTISEHPREGWVLAEDQGDAVALDLQLTPGLVRSGLAREVVRLVQDARKKAGLDVGDRISLVWSASGETAAALREHGCLVAAEVLAARIHEGDPVRDEASSADNDAIRELTHDSDLQLSFSVTKMSTRSQEG